MTLEHYLLEKEKLRQQVLQGGRDYAKEMIEKGKLQQAIETDFFQIIPYKWCAALLEQGCQEYIDAYRVINHA